MNSSLSNDMFNLTTMNSRMKNILDAWLKYGTVFLIYRLCTYFFFERNNANATFLDRNSLKFALFILIGFTIYYAVIAPYIPVGFEHPILRNVGNDTLMFGTVLISAHLLEEFSGDGEYFNMEWLKTAGMILVAFASYRVIVQPFIPNGKFKPTVTPIVNDWAQFGTFLIVFRLLQQKSIDQTYILSCLFALLGFTGYHLITKKLINVK